MTPFNLRAFQTPGITRQTVCVFNYILALADFVFFSQLLRRRKIQRYEYHYTGRHLRRVTLREKEEGHVQKVGLLP